MTTIKGWEASHRYTQIAVRTLRELHAAGTLRGTKNEKGVWEFSSHDLDTIAAANGKAPGAMIAAPVAPLSTAASASTLSNVLAWAERAADAARDATEGGDEHAEPEDDEVDELDDAAPRAPVGPPLGSSRTWLPIESWPSVSSAPSSGLQQLAAAQGELEQQLAATQAEREQARVKTERAQAEREYWRSAWRTTRIRSIADTIAFELQAARYDAALVQAAAGAAAQAVGQLQDAQLGSPWTIDYGRQVAGWLIAVHDDNDIERARERRRWRPRPRPRW